MDDQSQVTEPAQPPQQGLVQKGAEGADVKPGKRLKTKTLILCFFIFLMAGIVLPTSFLLIIGLMPTYVVILSGRRGRRSQAVSVGAMNLAGCSPFLFQLWTEGHTFDLSVNIVSDPLAVVVMYAGAGAGYVIDWALGGVMGVFIHQRKTARLKTIEKQQEELVATWGEVVRGDFPLDSEGFPIQNFES